MLKDPKKGKKTRSKDEEDCFEEDGLQWGPEGEDNRVKMPKVSIYMPCTKLSKTKYCTFAYMYTHMYSCTHTSMSTHGYVLFLCTYITHIYSVLNQKVPVGLKHHAVKPEGAGWS